MLPDRQQRPARRPAHEQNDVCQHRHGGQAVDKARQKPAQIGLPRPAAEGVSAALQGVPVQRVGKGFPASGSAPAHALKELRPLAGRSLTGGVFEGFVLAAGTLPLGFPVLLPAASLLLLLLKGSDNVRKGVWHENFLGK